MKTLTVAVGDVWPGVCNVDMISHYCPWFLPAYYDDTFRQLDQDPDTPDEQLVIYQPWHRMLRQIFGAYPTESTPLNKGRAWRWQQAIQRLRLMHRSIRHAGYSYGRATRSEQIRLRISSEGRICVCQGNKRASLLRTDPRYGPDFEVQGILLEDLDSWKEFKRDQLYPPGKEEVYMPVEHPDLAAWSQRAPQPCTERWAMIQPFLKGRGKLLDLGCHTGWFCRRAHELGWTAVGVDNSRPEIRMAKLMNSWSPRCQPTGIDYVLADIKQYLDGTTEQFDACLCLSVLMHVGRERKEDVYDVLRKTSQVAPLLFVDCSWGAYQKNLPFTEHTIVPDVLRQTQYKQAELLGHGKRERRPLFKLSR